jgi:hypothetical protein
VDHAYELLAPILKNPALGRAIARKGQSDVMLSHGNRAVGLRMLDRLEQLVGG